MCTPCRRSERQGLFLENSRRVGGIAASRDKVGKAWDLQMKWIDHSPEVRDLPVSSP